MRSRLGVVASLLVIGLSSQLDAQTPATPTNSFAIDQSAPDLTTANSYGYKVYADGAATGSVIAMKCTGTTSPFTCVAPVGAFTPGPHSVTFTASNAAGESAKSAPLAFILVIIPSVPANPRIQ